MSESHNLPAPKDKPADREATALALPLDPESAEEFSSQDLTIAAVSARIIPVTTKPNHSRPTLIEVFTGQAIDVIDKIFQAHETTDKLILELREAQEQLDKLLHKNGSLSEEQRQASKHNVERLAQLERIRKHIGAALTTYQWTPGKIWLYQWSLVLLLILCGIAQACFIEIYCRWHGAYFLSLDLFTPDNINRLSTITFVNGATTLSMAGEVLTWSSLGVWAQQSYAMTVAMVQRRFRFADHGPLYIGVMMRNTSVAAAIVILLRLSKFSVFGVSLDSTNPLAFDTTIGISFLLGFFGDDAYRILTNFKNRLMKGTEESK